MIKLDRPSIHRPTDPATAPRSCSGSDAPDPRRNDNGALAGGRRGRDSCWKCAERGLELRRAGRAHAPVDGRSSLASAGTRSSPALTKKYGLAPAAEPTRSVVCCLVARCLHEGRRSVMHVVSVVALTKLLVSDTLPAARPEGGVADRLSHGIEDSELSLDFRLIVSDRRFDQTDMLR